MPDHWVAAALASAWASDTTGRTTLRLDPAPTIVVDGIVAHAGDSARTTHVLTGLDDRAPDPQGLSSDHRIVVASRLLAQTVLAQTVPAQTVLPQTVPAQTVLPPGVGDVSTASPIVCRPPAPVRPADLPSMASLDPPRLLTTGGDAVRAGLAASASDIDLVVVDDEVGMPCWKAIAASVRPGDLWFDNGRGELDLSNAAVAQAHGAVLIARREFGAIHDLIVDLSNGVLVDDHELEAVVADLANDGRRRRRMAWEGSLHEARASWSSLFRACRPPATSTQLPILDLFGGPARQVRWRNRLIGPARRLVVIAGSGADRSAAMLAVEDAGDDSSGDARALVIADLDNLGRGDLDPGSGMRALSLARCADRVVIVGDLSDESSRLLGQLRA